MVRQEYRLLLTKKGTFLNWVRFFTRPSRSEVINIAGDDYVLRDYAGYDMDDQSRNRLVRSAVESIRQSPKIGEVSTQTWIETEGVVSDFDKNALVCFARFSRAKVLPPLKEDVGDHEYFFVDGERYRLDVSGDFDRDNMTSFEFVNMAQGVLRNAYRGRDVVPKEMILGFDRDGEIQIELGKEEPR